MASSAKLTTIRHLLTQAKPALSCTSKANKNTINVNWPQVGSDAIELWDDFNLATLDESYGHILDREVPAERVAQVPRAESVLKRLVVTEPKDILRLISWNDQILRPTLAFAREHLGLHTGLELQHSVKAPDRSTFAHITGVAGKESKQVDHCVALDEFPMPNLVIGLGRPSPKFKARQVADRPEGVRREGLWPLRQLANLCNMAKTRYGYILTEQDLLVCCFKKSGKAWKVALMPIPWTRYSDAQLTTDLALWWLCMLALSAPKNRALEETGGDDLIGIGEWETRFLDDERGWVRRHRYSRVEQPTEPPPPPAYQTPPPDNLAAFEAAVGINADPNFSLFSNCNTDA